MEQLEKNITYAGAVRSIGKSMGKIAMHDTWEISVTELMTIFKEAIISIIPWLEKAKIPWKEGEIYDDGEDIYRSLYENIVIGSILREILPINRIAKYGFHYENYSEMDYILVISSEHSNNRLAFVLFETLSTPLDNVKVAILDDSDIVIGFLILKQEGLKYAFVKNNNGTDKEIISEVNVVR